MTGLHELSVSVHIAASPETCWKIWTERLEEWWCPKPWITKLIEMDLRPGGRSAMVMRGPDGEGSPDPLEGVFLEVVPNRRIVTTDAFSAGWAPQTPFMTAVWDFAPEGDGTRYTATARHWTGEAQKRHEEMGFHPGWDMVAEQFKTLCESG